MKLINLILKYFYYTFSNFCFLLRDNDLEKFEKVSLEFYCYQFSEKYEVKFIVIRWKNFFIDNNFFNFINNHLRLFLVLNLDIR